PASGESPRSEPPPPQETRISGATRAPSNRARRFMIATFGSGFGSRRSISRSRFYLQRFIHDEEIGQERAQVYRRVQIVDELRAHVGPREDERDHGSRNARVGV